jgi:hypothetical protein
MELAELYEKTADILEQRGMTQGRYEDEEGRLCLFGGVHVALGGKPMLAGESHVRCGVLDSDLHYRLGMNPVRWSDRLVEQGDAGLVIARLREVAREIRAGVASVAVA